MSERTWEERQAAKKLREFVGELTEPGPKYTYRRKELGWLESSSGTWPGTRPSRYTYRRKELGWLESLACHLEGDEDALLRAKAEDLL